MPEELLDAVQWDAGRDKSRGERMAERVPRDGLDAALRISPKRSLLARGASSRPCGRKRGVGGGAP